MKIGSKASLFVAKLGHTLTNNFKKKKNALKTSQKNFLSNLHKISDLAKNNQHITTYVHGLLNHSEPIARQCTPCKRLVKQLRKELELRKASPKHVIKLTNNVMSLFNKEFGKSHKSPKKPSKPTVFGKYPKADFRLKDLKKHVQDTKTLTKIFNKLLKDATEHDPDLTQRIATARAQRAQGHLTFAYPENRIANLNASRIELGNKETFILAGAPRNKVEIVDHLYHAVIEQDCGLWFTLNECIDRPKFWAKSHLADLKFPKNWTITNVTERTILEHPLKSSKKKSNSNPKLVQSLLIAENGQSTKKIIHYHYDNWIDRMPAPCNKILLECAKLAIKHIQKTGKPVGINCKGGVGRTGVLMNIIDGMMHINKELASGKKLGKITINPAELNYDLRKKRPSLVSYAPQFIQVCQVLSDYVEELKLLK